MATQIRFSLHLLNRAIKLGTKQVLYLVQDLCISKIRWPFSICCILAKNNSSLLAHVTNADVQMAFACILCDAF